MRHAPSCRQRSSTPFLRLIRTLLWLGLPAGSVLDAAPITLQQAQQAAQRFHEEKSNRSSVATARREQESWNTVSLLTEERIVIGYVATSATGFVLVRADSNCPPVKFYAMNGSYDALPPAFRSIIEAELAAELGYVQGTATLSNRAQDGFAAEWARLLDPASSATANSATTAASDMRLLATAAWDQLDPYNLYCPPAPGGPGGRAPTGCSATALAIILRYHRWPLAIAKDYRSTGSGGRVSQVGLEPYDWDNMPTAGLTRASPTVQQDAVARLMFHCSILANSWFEAGGTTGWYEPPALREFLGYTCTERLYRRYFTNEEWMRRVRTDIDNGRPIMWGMNNLWVAHALVCDGYDGEHTVHFNLGWSGYANGWYDLRNAVPTGSITFREISHNANFELTPAGTLPQLPTPPEITAHPTDCTAAPGESLKLSVAASGNPAPSILWYKNGVPLPLSGGSFLLLANLQPSDAGVYHAVARNESGETPSATATVRVIPLNPTVTAPASTALSGTVGKPTALGFAAADAKSVQWYRNGRPIAATDATLRFPSLTPGDAGFYDAVATLSGGDTITTPTVLGVLPAAGERTAGAVFTRPEWQNIHHPNGATYDQFLLSGTAGTFSVGGISEISRMSFLDPQGSIVQVEMSGAGAITVVLDPATASGPKAPALYNQSGVEYMQGKATIILAGANETTHFTIYSVGTATNPGVTRPDANYAGWADVAAAGIVTTDGKLGGIHQGNANYNATVGYAGLYAPGVATVNGLVVVHDIAASDFARPLLQFAPGGTVEVKIAGGALSQPSGDALTVDGLAKLTLGAGQDSCGRPAPAKALATRLVDPDGTDVTATIVSRP